MVVLQCGDLLNRTSETHVHLSMKAIKEKRQVTSINQNMLFEYRLCYVNLCRARIIMPSGPVEEKYFLSYTNKDHHLIFELFEFGWTLPSAVRRILTDIKKVLMNANLHTTANCYCNFSQLTLKATL